MLALVMLVTCINYLERANLSIAAPTIQKEFQIDAVTLGYLLSAFGWVYTIFLPLAGVLLDRIGPRLLYAVSVVGWSAATFAVGLAGSITALFGFRIAVGLFEAPAFPTNVRCVTAWFPASERAFAVGGYTAMTYFAPGFLTPLLAWILVAYGWKEIFYITGLIGIAIAAIWWLFYRDPAEARIEADELDYIKAGGGLGDAAAQKVVHEKPLGTRLSLLLAHRQVWGMFIGQFSVQTTLFFFLTWFPAYLINGKGLTILKGGFYAAIPYLAATIGTIIAGKWSDWMVHRGMSNTVARKLPIIIGFLLSSVIMGANYTDAIGGVLLFMSVAFFGQAMASTVTGALLSDIAPRGMVGTMGGLLYFVANVGGTLAPIVIGYIVGQTGGFSLALVYVSAVAMMGVLAYLFILGPVYRIEISEERPKVS
jgi:ACS family D-galactonate transporter-like MFS transporter